MSRFNFLLFIRVLLLFFWLSIGTIAKAEPLKIGVTTSIRDSGMMARYVENLKQHSLEVDFIVFGTGRIIQLMLDGDVDIVITHSPEIEMQLLKNNKISSRWEFAKNYFFLVGPLDNTARIGQGDSLEQAMQKILDSESKFVSRGDNSGTHNKEKLLWRPLIDYSELKELEHYYSTGQSMGVVINLANSLGAYTLVDMATWFNYKSRLVLKIYKMKHDKLINTYSFLLRAFDDYSKSKVLLIDEFFGWFVDRGLDLTFNYRINGEILFEPVAKLEKSYVQDKNLAKFTNIIGGE